MTIQTTTIHGLSRCLASGQKFIVGERQAADEQERHITFGLRGLHTRDPGIDATFVGARGLVDVRDKPLLRSIVIVRAGGKRPGHYGRLLYIPSREWEGALIAATLSIELWPDRDAFRGLWRHVHEPNAPLEFSFDVADLQYTDPAGGRRVLMDTQGGEDGLLVEGAGWSAAARA